MSQIVFSPRTIWGLPEALLEILSLYTGSEPDVDLFNVTLAWEIMAKCNFVALIAKKLLMIASGANNYAQW